MTKQTEQYKYVLPEWSLNAIHGDGRTLINHFDFEKLERFYRILDKTQKDIGAISYIIDKPEGERYFSRKNDIDLRGSYCYDIDVTFIF